ncbi:MAG: insulinase family protein [Magnetococcales bacterium]|nr:insulinase family protein [Magnetococcales bacterium]
MLSTPLMAMESRELRLDNGMSVVLVRENKAPVVVTQMWYKVGSMDETLGKSGLSHMLEHMMFQGTKTVPPEEFSKLIAREGGEDNASTSSDYTMYYIKLASDRIELALRLEADRMRGLQLEEKEFKSENLVVREERRVRTDSDPNQRMMEKFRQTAYGDHPYARPVIGTMAEIEALTLNDLKTWYNGYYAPNNATLVVVGNMDLDQTEKLVRHYFAPMAAHPGLTHAVLKDLPSQDSPRRLEVSDKATKLPYWVAGYAVPTLAMSEWMQDAFPLDVLSVILGNGNTSRLHQRMIRERGLAVSAHAGYSGFSRSWELFTLSAMPKPGVDLKELEKALFEEVSRLAEEQVSARELEKACNGLIAEHVYAMDSIDRIAWLIGRMRVNDLDWRIMFEEYPRRVRAVTAQDIQRVAAQYLRPERVTVGILQP